MRPVSASTTPVLTVSQGRRLEATRAATAQAKARSAKDSRAPPAARSGGGPRSQPSTSTTSPATYTLPSDQLNQRGKAGTSKTTGTHW